MTKETRKELQVGRVEVAMVLRDSLVLYCGTVLCNGVVRTCVLTMGTSSCAGSSPSSCAVATQVLEQEAAQVYSTTLLEWLITTPYPTCSRSLLLCTWLPMLALGLRRDIKLLGGAGHLDNKRFQSC